MLDGPRLPPRSGGATDSLVILLHGYGADGRDLIELGEIWAPLLPGTAFVSPHAPEPCAMAPVGRQWFGYIARDDRERWSGVEAAHPALDGFIDAELARHQLSASRLALVGFSQGTMMALHTGLKRAAPLAGIVGFSGIHVQPPAREPETARAIVASRPPVLLIHGDQDPVIPVGALTRARVTLARAGIAPETHIARGLGHGIDEDGLNLAGRFLVRVLGN